MIDEGQVQKLGYELQEKREYGVVHFSIGEIPEFNRRRPDKAIVNGYFALHFISFDEKRWSLLDPSDAEAILIQLFRFNQAYHVEIMSFDEAKVLTKQIIDLLLQDSRYYTYGIGVNGFGGVIAFINGDQVGLIAIFDED